MFIANLYSQGFNDAAGMELTSKQINFAIYSQMMMGVLGINSVSLSIGMFTLMARDLETQKTDSFLLTNVKPWQIITSYLLAAFIVSLVLNFFMLVLSVLIIGIATFWWSAATFFQIFGAMIVTTFESCAIVLLLTIVIRSSTAIGVINGILGTILGFLCGIYMPYQNMAAAAKYVGSVIPLTHCVVWMKQIVLTDVFGQIGIPEAISVELQDKWFSAGNVGLFGADVPLWAMILLGVILAVACLAISVFLLRRKLYRRDRLQKIVRSSAPSE